MIGGLVNLPKEDQDHGSRVLASFLPVHELLLCHLSSGLFNSGLYNFGSCCFLTPPHVRMFVRMFIVFEQSDEFNDSLIMLAMGTHRCVPVYSYCVLIVLVIAVVHCLRSRLFQKHTNAHQFDSLSTLQHIPWETYDEVSITHRDCVVVRSFLHLVQLEIQRLLGNELEVMTKTSFLLFRGKCQSGRHLYSCGREIGAYLAADWGPKPGHEVIGLFETHLRACRVSGGQRPHKASADNSMRGPLSEASSLRPTYV